jgi:hypothetical protein
MKLLKDQKQIARETVKEEMSKYKILEQLAKRGALVVTDALEVYESEMKKTVSKDPTTPALEVINAERREEVTDCVDREIRVLNQKYGMSRNQIAEFLQKHERESEENKKDFARMKNHMERQKRQKGTMIVVKPKSELDRDFY